MKTKEKLGWALLSVLLIAFSSAALYTTGSTLYEIVIIEVTVITVIGLFLLAFYLIGIL